ncbi:hypothetical protein GOP47_0000552 [Adiantum capillus-veneris]|uniref:RRM domain-containing protein n=1 Tax=Adiantum capillus-veneris TaxID=13818 RepID=A0A9D4ZQU0_ADICA|nr:hypothetical protein GOP47_0000552 [Adiantum capillus-veneris]
MPMAFSSRFLLPLLLLSTSFCSSTKCFTFEEETIGFAQRERSLADDNTCGPVNCLNGICSTSIIFPFYQCTCNEGWQSPLNLSWIPCVLPNCSFDLGCDNTSLSAPPPAVSPTTDAFSLCALPICGNGECVASSNSSLLYECKCNGGSINLFNSANGYCIPQCAAGAELKSRYQAKICNYSHHLWIFIAADGMAFLEDYLIFIHLYQTGKESPDSVVICKLEEVEELVEKVGNVDMVIHDKDSGRSHGFGFVTMSSIENCNAAIGKGNWQSRGFGFVTIFTEAEVHEALNKMDCASVQGRNLRVNIVAKDLSLELISPRKYAWWGFNLRPEAVIWRFGLPLSADNIK